MSAEIFISRGTSLMASMPLSFGMMALEFLRFLVRRESPYGTGLIAGD